MKIDLFHNKIVKETATAQFVSSVERMLVPMIGELYGDAEKILMYEDHIADGFMREGVWYYPLTVRRPAGSETVWICWPFDKQSFATASPYSYVGEGDLAFELCDAVPSEIADLMNGRAIDYDESAIKINVRATAADVMLLCGHYSQTFVDQMASQITKNISSALSIEGLGDSTIELELMFAPGTYMEHTSENVTYRRLLMVDGASRPRDFWVKWTRVGGGVAYTVSDAVGADDIVFELGEDVAHKIREKEYRFLCSTNPNTYQAAMGKRAVTEWRDLVKRAIRRGEIIRVESELEVAERASEVYDKLSEVLGALGQRTPAAEESSRSTAPTDGGFDSLMDLVRAALEKSEGHGAEDALLDMPMIELDLDGGMGSTDDAEVTEDVIPDEAPEEIPEADAASDSSDEENIEDEPIDGEDEDLAEESDEEVNEELDEEDTEEISEDDEEVEEPVADLYTPDAPLTIDELLRRLEEAANAPIDEPDEDDTDEDDTVAEESVVEDHEELRDEVVEVEASEEPTDDREDEETIADTDDESDISNETEEVVEADDVELKAIDEESIRREIEERIRREYEERARARAEAEIARLIAESNALREENERLARAARNAEAMHRQAISDHLDATERARATEDMLRAELEAKERREARERDRLAEAARIAVEEQRRREAEMEERYRIEREEAERLERERLERERIAEQERIRAEEAERARREAEAAALAAEPKFISKRAKIIFRRAADANVIGKIREIIEETIKANNKQHVRIHMKAYQEDRDVVNLDVLKMPAEEQELLIAIVKAIGNARIGVIKIILE